MFLRNAFLTCVCVVIPTQTLHFQPWGMFFNNLPTHYKNSVDGADKKYMVAIKRRKLQGTTEEPFYTFCL